VEVSIPKLGEALGPTLGDALGSILGDVLGLVLGEDLMLGEAVGIGLRLGPLAGPSVGELVVGTLDGLPVGAIICSRTLLLVSLSSSPIHWPLPRTSVGEVVGLDDGTLDGRPVGALIVRARIFSLI
jgi:hypothetical protein